MDPYETNPRDADAVRAAVDEAVAAHSEQLSPPKRLRRRRTDQRLLAVAAGAVFIAAGAVGGGFALSGHPGNDRNDRVHVAAVNSTPATSAPPSPPPTRSTPPPPTRSPTASSVPSTSAALPPEQPAPATFLGAVGAGGERTAVFDAATGRLSRYLESTGSQALDVYSHDGKTVWAMEGGGTCGRWTRIDVATGATSPAFADIPNLEGFDVSPDGRRLAWEDCSFGLHVRDLRHGTDRAIRSSYGGAFYLRWSPDSRLLVVNDGRNAAVLDASHAQTTSDGTVFVASAACHYDVGHDWAGSSTQVLLSRTCNPADAHGDSVSTLVEGSVATGAVHDLAVLGHGPYDIGVTNLVADASGHHLLYTVSNTTTGTYRMDDLTARLLTTDVYQLGWGAAAG